MNFFLNIFYRFIYHPKINFIIRNLNYFLKDLFFNKVKIPPSGILKLKTDSGVIKIATNQTSYLTQLLFWNGYKQFEYSSIFEDLSKNITSFLDIGSNIGYYSLLAVKSNSNIKAYAFEPAKRPKHYLKTNIKLNHFENNIAHENIALSNVSGKIDFYEVGNIKYKYLEHNLAGEGNAGTKTTSRNFIKNTVNSKTLNQFFEDNKIKNIDLIKIDTEGTEIDILISGLDRIKKFQPIIICEILFNNIESELDDFFNSLDYQVFNHTPLGLIKVSTIKRKKDDGIRNCFFVPKSKLHLISKYVLQL